MYLSSTSWAIQREGETEMNMRGRERMLQWELESEGFEVGEAREGKEVVEEVDGIGVSGGRLERRRRGSSEGGDKQIRHPNV
jgi:hypothetical protein